VDPRPKYDLAEKGETNTCAAPPPEDHPICNRPIARSRIAAHVGETRAEELPVGLERGPALQRPRPRKWPVGERSIPDGGRCSRNEAGVENDARGSRTARADPADMVPMASAARK